MEGLNLFAPLLANGILFGAFIGMMIGAIIAAVISSGRKPADGAEPEKLERHVSCPNCGSKKFTLAQTKVPWSDSGFFWHYKANDRCCKQCGTVYHMRFPTWACWFFMAMGLPIAIFGVVLFFMEGEIIAPIACVFAGSFIFAMGLLLPRH